jgi:hypothetical protein
MLSTLHKVNILHRAGIAVPPASTTFLLSPSERASAQSRWESTVENLFIAYAMARAEKSLGYAAEPGHSPLTGSASSACQNAYQSGARPVRIPT